MGLNSDSLLGKRLLWYQARCDCCPLCLEVQWCEHVGDGLEVPAPPGSIPTFSVCPRGDVERVSCARSLCRGAVGSCQSILQDGQIVFVTLQVSVSMVKLMFWARSCQFSRTSVGLVQFQTWSISVSHSSAGRQPTTHGRRSARVSVEMLHVAGQ